MSAANSSRSGTGSMLLTPPPASPHGSNESPSPPATSELLPPTRSAIERFARRRAQLQFGRGLAVGVVCLIVGMLMLVVIDYFWSMATPLRALGTLLVDVAALMAAWLCGVRQSRMRDWTAIARSMEAATPPLRERLLSAVELEDPRRANGSIEFRSSLQSGVAGELSSIDIRRMLPWRLVRAALFAAVGAGVVVALLSLIPSLQLPRRLARAFVPIAPIERASITQLRITAPQPASKSVAHGDLVAVVAAVKKLGRGEVYLQWQSDDGGKGSLRMSPRTVMPVEERAENKWPNAPRSEWSTAERSATISDSHFPLVPKDGSTKGVSGEQPTDASDPPADQSASYAINLQVDRSVVHYRVLAGDAESNWYTLTPMPRPHVVEFAKKYHFPSYVKLPDVESIEEYGDLEALVGTRAEVTVTFDQPVRAAQVWFGDYGNDVAVPMQSVDDDPKRFRFEVAIQTPGSYRIDAISLQSELDNPFLPHCMIDPIIDRAPTAVWSASIPTRQMSSSAAVLRFPGRIEDDVPMDHYVIESIVDSGPIRERVVPLDPIAMQQEVEWNGDLMDLSGSGTQGEALPAGTLLRVRLVALDRGGKRGESDWRYVYIAGEQFDPNRHAALFAWQALVADLNLWFTDLQDLTERIKTAAQQAQEHTDAEGFAPDGTFATELDLLDRRWQKIAGPMDPKVLQRLAQERAIDDVAVEPNTLSEMMFRSPDSVLTDQESLIDRYAVATVMELQGTIEAWQFASDLGESLAEPDRKRAVDAVAAAARRVQGRVKSVSELPARLLASQLAKALIRDWNAIGEQTSLLVDEDSSVPIERLPGQANLLAERIRQVEELIESLDHDLPDETQRHLKNLRRFLAESIFRIEQANEKLRLDRNPDVEKNFRDSIAVLLKDMQQHHTGGFVHGNTFNKIAGAVRDLGREDQQSRAAIETLRRDGREWMVSRERLDRIEEQQNSEEIAPLVAQEKLRLEVFAAQRNELIQRYDRAEARQRVRPDMNVAVASDFKLVRQVIEHVTGSEFVPIADESPSQILDRISKAATRLEAGGQLMRLAAQLQDIADRERFGNNPADRAIDQGIRLEHFQVFSETPLQQFRSTEIDNEVLEDLQATRWDSDFSQARQWITQRRYDSRPFLSAAAPVQSLADRYRVAMPAIQAVMAEARETLRAFLPTTSELAKEAADEAKKLRAKSQSEPDPSESDKSEPQSEANALEQSIDDLQAKVDRLADDLVDRANEADLSNAAERELARDADAALQKIQQQMDAVSTPLRQPEKSVSPAEANENLEQLADTLETTAAHFAAAEAGEELSQTREELRENRELDALEESLQDASATSDLAQTSPEELLKQLERQLQRDPPMQADLSDISRRTVADVEQAVRAAADQEDRLQRELEKADPQLFERKKQLRDQLRSLSDQSRAVNDQWLNAAERASARAENEAAREAVREMREELRSAAEQADRVQNDQALLEEIHAASQQLQETLQHAAEKSRELSQEANQAAGEEIHPSEKSRDQRAEQLEADQLRTQNEWIKSLGRQIPQWHQRREEAGRRVQQAEKQKRDAEKQLDQAEQQLQKKPDQESLQQRVRETQQRVDDASRAAEAATGTRQAAEQAEQQAEKFANVAKKEPVNKLEAQNPTAESLARASEISQHEMERLATGLKRLTQDASPGEAPKPRRSSAESLAQSQGQTRQTARQAADDLRRAARHEERLGNTDAAHQLDAAAKELQETTDSSIQNAQENLQQAAETEPTESGGEPAKAAHQNLGIAADQLADQADALSVMAEAIRGTGSPTGSSDGASQAASSAERTGTLDEADRPEKLARALDELDRAIFGSVPAESTEGASTQGEAAEGSGQTAAGESGDSESAASGSGKPASTAGEASPTLAAAAQQAARRLAAERQQRLSQIASSGKPGANEGEPPQRQSGKPGSQSGDSFEMPAGGLLSLDDEMRADGQWGALRERASDDVIQDRKASVPLPYRNAIEAYFQTIAGEASRARGGATETRDNPAEDTP